MANISCDLEQVEEMLKTQEPASKTPDMSRPSFPLSNAAHSHNSGLLGTPNADFGVTNPDIGVVNDRDHERWHFPGDSPQPPMEDMTFDPNLNMTMTMDPTFTWEMIGLGLDEPLPPQETIDELYVISSLLQILCSFGVGIKFTSRKYTHHCR
jgi:hypothetical protein